MPQAIHKKRAYLFGWLNDYVHKADRETLTKPQQPGSTAPTAGDMEQQQQQQQQAYRTWCNVTGRLLLPGNDTASPTAWYHQIPAVAASDADSCYDLCAAEYSRLSTTRQSEFVLVQKPAVDLGLHGASSWRYPLVYIRLCFDSVVFPDWSVLQSVVAVIDCCSFQC